MEFDQVSSPSENRAVPHKEPQFYILKLISLHLSFIVYEHT